jgi:hypothetical protein
MPTRDIINIVPLTRLSKLNEKIENVVRLCQWKALYCARNMGATLIQVGSLAAAGALRVLTILRFYLEASCVRNIINTVPSTHLSKLGKVQNNLKYC